MTKKLFKRAELKLFDRLSTLASDQDQMTRIRARLELTRFVAAHGKEKCEAMWDELATKVDTKCSNPK